MDPAWAPAREPYLIHPFLLTRRAVIETVGGYRSLRTSQDTDLYWRLREYGRLHNLPGQLGKYRVHENSVSGGHISSGRVMAVCSQLAALSALRTRRGLADITFPIMSRIFERHDYPIEDMVAEFEAELSPLERKHLRISVGAKLMQLANYRNYELEISDCRFIARAKTDGLLRKNAREVQWYRSSGLAALSEGALLEGAIVAGPIGLPRVLAKAFAEAWNEPRVQQF